MSNTNNTKQRTINLLALIRYGAPHYAECVVCLARRRVKWSRWWSEPGADGWVYLCSVECGECWAAYGAVAPTLVLDQTVEDGD